MSSIGSLTWEKSIYGRKGILSKQNIVLEYQLAPVKH
jgi:hypothetical protein